jgi:isopentenyl diphosphate isomerase/L-lactate dehydrogenase-like FMN-dependent dehydrogenase
MVSGDFDENGVPDLVVGVAGSGNFALSFYQGDADSLYPDAPEARQRRSLTRSSISAALSPAKSIRLVSAPDFLVATIPGADLAVSRAAAAEGVPMIFSSQGSISMEACAAAMGDAPRWFQLYCGVANELVTSFVQRAEACGCEAVVVTLDTTMLGWRQRDLDLGFLPFLYGKGIAQYTSDPVFQRQLDDPPEAALPQGRVTPAALRALVTLTRAYPGPFWANIRSSRPRDAIRLFLTSFSRPSLTWDDLPFLREQTRLPLLLKGILHADDARRAVELGVDGVVVSNHGGRQVDGSISSIAALPSIIEAVADRVPVLLDSGVRGGADGCRACRHGRARR